MIDRISRRDFIKSSTVVVGAVSLGITEFTYSSQENTSRWALLSDTHIPACRTETSRGFSMIKNMDAIVPAVAEFKPTGTAIAGDIARLTGEVGDYRVAK